MRLIDADAVCERCRASGAICTGKDCEIPNMPTLTPPNEWVSVEERLPEPGERVLAAKGTFVGEAYLASNGAWMRHDGFPWEVDAWMPLPAPPESRPPEGEAVKQIVEKWNRREAQP